MKKLFITSILLLSLSSPLVYAGVVMELVTTDASGQETNRSKIYAQSEMIRMDEGGDSAAGGSMIFLGNEFLYLDHEDKSYIVMDEAMLDEVSAQMSEAMKEMEAQLASMPPEQRAMVEQMMKGQMQGMMGQQGDSSPTLRVEETGKGKWQSYTCRNYRVSVGAEKTEDICAAELDEIDGADELMEAFRNMAAYMTKLTESMPMGAKDRMNPGELMEQIDGFPVNTIYYENGSVVREESLDSVTEQDLEPGMFAAPEGYRREDPFGGR
jgi:hypothetical protein